MKCDIIKDLIPLSAEGLCSEESETAIAEHIKTCESCRTLYEKLPEPDPAPLQTPDETETFKKVSRKIKKLTWRSAIISTALAAVILSVGYLTAGQILKTSRIYSFETIFQNMEAKKVAKLIENKDFEGYIDSISRIGNSSHFDDPFFLKKSSQEYDAKLLADVYERGYGDAEIAGTECITIYVDKVPTTTLRVNLADGKSVWLFLKKGLDGKLYMDTPGFAADAVSPDGELGNALGFVNGHTTAMRFTEGLYNKHTKNTSESIAWRYNIKYNEQVKEKRTAFFKAHFKIETVYFSHIKFDDDKQMYYYDATATVSDDKGTATALTRLYVDHMGLIPPEHSTVTVHTDGCTDKLAEMMYDFFG